MRAFSFLSGGVRSNSWALEDLTGVDGENATGH
jgi:hypothetical protein